MQAIFSVTVKKKKMWNSIFSNAIKKSERFKQSFVKNKWQKIVLGSIQKANEHETASDESNKNQNDFYTKNLTVQIEHRVTKKLKLIQIKIVIDYNKAKKALNVSLNTFYK